MIFGARTNILVNLRVQFKDGTNVAGCARCLWEEPYDRSTDGRAKYAAHNCSGRKTT